MTKKLIYATVAGAVLQFLLGWLVYGFILADVMSGYSNQFEGLLKEMNSPSFMILIFLSGLVMSFLLGYLFQRWAKFDTFMQGLKGGLFFGFFLALSLDLYFYASMNLMNLTGYIIDIIISTIMTGILGGVIGWILGYKTKPEG